MNSKTNAPITHPVYLKAVRGEYVTHTDIAVLIRSALKAEFPGAKFAVKSSSYSMGCSVDVSWTDGPTARQVESIIGQFDTKDFDGSIDMATTRTIWLAPDGSASNCHGRGTVGSAGSIPETIGSAHHPDAVMLTDMSHPWVKACRHTSSSFIARAAREMLDRTNTPDGVDCDRIAHDFERGNLWNRKAPWCGGDEITHGSDCSSWQAWLYGYLGRMSESSSPMAIR